MGGGDKDRFCSRESNHSAVIQCFPHIGPSLENAYPVLLSGAWRNQVVSRILRERRLWLGREAPLWIVLLTRTEYRHERDRAPTETDTVRAGTPTPVSVVFMTAP